VAAAAIEGHVPHCNDPQHYKSTLGLRKRSTCGGREWKSDRGAAGALAPADSRRIPSSGGGEGTLGGQGGRTQLVVM